MKFVTKIQLVKAKKIHNREDFCLRYCMECKRGVICYMCHSLDESELHRWLEQVQHRWVYVLEMERFPKRRKCPWCECSEYNESHFNAHGKTGLDACLLETQKELAQELTQVRRTGRWWAVGVTFGSCQQCLIGDANSASDHCILSTTPKSRVRCAASLCLDLRKVVKTEELWRYGMIIV